MQRLIEIFFVTLLKIINITEFLQKNVKTYIIKFRVKVGFRKSFVHFLKLLYN